MAESARKSSKPLHKTSTSVFGREAARYEIDQLSDDIAVVTFRLPSTTGVGLRTFIWKRFSNGWKIVHQHASSVEGTAK
jgi:hypothetical protein